VIVDSSAVVAILLREPSYERVLERLGSETQPGISAVLARFLQESGLVVVPFVEEHWPAAIDAFRRFGKGRDPAGLNFGDCLTYATVRLAEEPLLCLGDDFATISGSPEPKP
jgi:ribonuclease VapC